MSRIYAQQKRPGTKASAPSYSAPTVHAPSMVSGASSIDLDAMMQAKFRQHFLDNQIPTAEAEADRIAASVSGARTPEEVKSQLGEKMGADFSNVTFHTDSAALKQADAMGARAYTTGSDVYFGQGGFDPGVAAHELVHTVQQGMVGSAMGTTAAPTGGVQMMPKWAKKLFGKKPTEEEKAQQLQAAENMMQNVIYQGDHYEEHQKKKLKKHQKHVNKYLDLRAPIEQTYREFAQDNHLSEEEFQKQLNSVYVPGFDTNPIKLGDMQAQLRQEIDSFGSNTPDVDIKGLDSKKMYKNAIHLNSLADDFQGLNLRNIRASDSKETGGISSIASMDANSKTREVRFNKKYYAPGTKVSSAKRKHGKFGWNTINDNYTLTHEAGHIANFAIKDKLNETSAAQGRPDPYTHHDPVTRGILADALISHSSNDKKLRSLLIKHAGLNKKADFSTPETAKLISQALNPTIVDGEEQSSALLKALYKKGYTSEYGSSSPTEMYAEAFGDHYHNEAKKKKYSELVQKRKLRKFEKNRNILSDVIVSRSKELFDDEEKRKQFLQIYG